MNKVITINLNGNAYQLEEAGYEALRDYLDHAARQLGGNPDKAEIMADIEQAIADKCRAVLGAYRTVVSTPDIKTIIAEMGPVDDGSAGAGQKTGDPAASAGPKTAGDEAGAASSPKRLYRVKEGKMIGGVCNGIAAYFAIDVSFVRLLFLVLAFLTFGTAVLVYLAMMIVVPIADTAAAKAAAFGIPATAQEFIRRAREGYYDGMKTFGDKQAHREWKRKFKQEMRGWKRDFNQQMRENAQQWRQNWHNYWGPPLHPPGWLFVVAPIAAILCTLIAFAWILAFISFLATGTIFGLVMPGHPAWWIVLLLLFLFYKLLTWPLRVIKRSFRRGYYHPVFWGGMGDGLVGLCFLGLLIWLAGHYIPQVHEVLAHLPVVLHRAADSIQQWWSQK